MPLPLHPHRRAQHYYVELKTLDIVKPSTSLIDEVTGARRGPGCGAGRGGGAVGVFWQHGPHGWGCRGHARSRLRAGGAHMAPHGSAPGAVLAPGAAALVCVPLRPAPLHPPPCPSLPPASAGSTVDKGKDMRTFYPKKPCNFPKAGRGAGLSLAGLGGAGWLAVHPLLGSKACCVALRQPTAASRIPSPGPYFLPCPALLWAAPCHLPALRHAPCYIPPPCQSLPLPLACPPLPPAPDLRHAGRAGGVPAQRGGEGLLPAGVQEGRCAARLAPDQERQVCVPGWVGILRGQASVCVQLLLYDDMGGGTCVGGLAWRGGGPGCEGGLAGGSSWLSGAARAGAHASWHTAHCTQRVEQCRPPIFLPAACLPPLAPAAARRPPPADERTTIGSTACFVALHSAMLEQDSFALCA